LGKTLSYALKIKMVSVSWRLGGFSVWEVENGKPGALVVELVKLFV
jgi:hypothetical protein